MPFLVSKVYCWRCAGITKKTGLLIISTDICTINVTYPVTIPPDSPMWSAKASSMCWNMKGWLQILRSCMIVFIKVLVPPLPCDQQIKKAFTPTSIDLRYCVSPDNFYAEDAKQRLFRSKPNLNLTHKWQKQKLQASNNLKPQLL